ncbi:hypothetical protein ACET3Z_027934 [Daucus carota]
MEKREISNFKNLSLQRLSSREGKQGNSAKWEEVIEISLGMKEEIKAQIARIRRLVDEKILAGVMKRELAAEEKAIEILMLSSWEGPIIRFKEEHLQERLEEGESKHLDFVKSNFRWVDENVCNLVEAGDLEGLRMTSNQIYYKSMRGMEGQRNNFAGDIQVKEKSVQQTGEEGWSLVERRKKKRQKWIYSVHIRYSG